MELSCLLQGVIAGVAGTLAFLACAVLVLGWLGGRVEAEIKEELQ